ncbi:MAG TPA: CPBP family glutamic-type intramembrane protease [Planctomycetota bacterium]|nr:CPBP family glutamic-type intramembrane protease [Planctomycetota bacterium]
MPKSPPERPASEHGYFAWSRDPAVGLFAVLPLWVAYEVLRILLTPQERNGAELLMLDVLGLMGSRGLVLLRILFLAGVVLAAVSLLRRQIPWLRVAAVSALEGMLYGLLLGPLAAAMATSVRRVLAAPGLRAVDLVGALGAGVFEELVFRLGLMSLLVLLGTKATRAFGLPRGLALGAAIGTSAVLFAAFHHLLGEPFQQGVFVFRTAAGVLLGMLMWLRGYGVCVYAHALYDLHYYLTQEP